MEAKFLLSKENLENQKKDFLLRNTQKIQMLEKKKKKNGFLMKNLEIQKKSLILL